MLYFSLSLSLSLFQFKSVSIVSFLRRSNSIAITPYFFIWLSCLRFIRMVYAWCRVQKIEHKIVTIWVVFGVLIFIILILFAGMVLYVSSFAPLPPLCSSHFLPSFVFCLLLIVHTFCSAHQYYVHCESFALIGMP